MSEPTTFPESRPSGPFFVSGRQHSGNTLLVSILANIPGCLAQLHENTLFEHRRRLDRVDAPARRLDEVVDLLRIEDPDARAGMAAHLGTWLAERGDADALEMYREGMRYATEVTGNRFWAQKATSYIFYAEEVLNTIPSSKIIYMLRNPFDISASKKRRDLQRERLIQTMVSWNKGITAAARLAASHPDRFMIIRYEDLVTEPQPTVEKLCGFLGVEFSPDYLDVGLINPAEAGYSLEATQRGISPDRVYGFSKHLTETEIVALDMLGRRSPLEEWYPDLPDLPPRDPARRVRAGAAIVISAGRFGFQYVRRSLVKPGAQTPLAGRLTYLWHRTRQRIG